MFILDCEALFSIGSSHSRQSDTAIPSCPIARELNFVMPIRTTAAEVAAMIRAADDSVLSVSVTDVYVNEEKLAGKKSVTFHLLL